MNYHPCTPILIQALLEIGTSRAYQAISDWDQARKIVDGDCLFLDRKATFRIKPVAKPTFHWLIKSKGKFAVTSSKYASEDDAKAGYSYPVQVIQKLED